MDCYVFELHERVTTAKAAPPTSQDIPRIVLRRLCDLFGGISCFAYDREPMSMIVEGSMDTFHSTHSTLLRKIKIHDAMNFQFYSDRRSPHVDIRLRKFPLASLHAATKITTRAPNVTIVPDFRTRQIRSIGHRRHNWEMPYQCSVEFPPAVTEENVKRYSYLTEQNTKCVSLNETNRE